MNALGILSEIIQRRNYSSLTQVLQAVENSQKGQLLEIAVLGQFKSGKSSLINHILNLPLLPTGVIPVTSIITRILYDIKENVVITFKNGNQKETSFEGLGQYIVEKENPGNIKEIERADIYLLQMRNLKGICLVDTPGLGSIFSHNSDATRHWLVNIGAALVTISAERPLADEDLSLIDEIRNYAPHTYIILTKTDLIRPENVNQIIDYLKSNILSRLHFSHNILTYTILNGEHCRKKLLEDIFLPLQNNISTEVNKISLFKTGALAHECFSLLQLTLKAAYNSEEDNLKLKNAIAEGQTNMPHISDELRLITNDIKKKIRNFTENLLVPSQQEIAQSLTRKFESAYKTHNGNLYRTVRWYEEWLAKTLYEEVLKLVKNQISDIENFHLNIQRQYLFFYESITYKLSSRVEQTTGIKMLAHHLVVETPHEITPDVSVSYTFDAQLELLWFLIPMRLFKQPLGKILMRKIEGECKKNLRRQASDLADLLSNLAENYRTLVWNVLQNQLKIIEDILSKRETDIEQIEKDITYVNQILTEINK